MLELHENTPSDFVSSLPLVYALTVLSVENVRNKGVDGWKRIPKTADRFLCPNFFANKHGGVSLVYLCVGASCNLVFAPDFFKDGEPFLGLPVLGLNNLECVGPVVYPEDFTLDLKVNGCKSKDTAEANLVFQSSFFSLDCSIPGRSSGSRLARPTV